MCTIDRERLWRGTSKRSKKASKRYACVTKRYTQVSTRKNAAGLLEKSVSCVSGMLNSYSCVRPRNLFCGGHDSVSSSREMIVLFGTELSHSFSYVTVVRTMITRSIRASRRVHLAVFRCPNMFHQDMRIFHRDSLRLTRESVVLTKEINDLRRQAKSISQRRVEVERVGLHES